MPGLVGIFSIGLAEIDLNLFDAMVSSINHRQIYEKTVTVDEKTKYAIASVKLPILRYAQLPFISETQKVKIWIHGEIYNEDADTSNQLQYVYNLYQKFGLNFPQYLNGSFLIILIDEPKRQVIIANDRTASKPLFYFANGQQLYCAPELKALLALPHIERKLNLSAVSSFFSCGYLLDGETWINDIKLLDNATTLVFSESGIQFIKYWNYAFDEDAKDLGAEYYQHMLSELIHKAVRNRIRTAHKYGILLSGGYDSRGILGCVLKEKNSTEIRTVSWGSREDIPESDCAVAKRLAEKLGVHHTFYPLDSEKLMQNMKDFIYLSDGATDACANYPESLKIFEKIREDLNIDILLRGDECFGWSATAFDEKTMFQTLGIYPLNTIEGFQKIIDAQNMPILESRINERFDTLSKKIKFGNIHNRKDFFYLDQRLKCYLNPLNYVKSIEIELRNPFIDNDILDFLVNLPEKYRIRKNLYIKTITELFPEIFTEMAYKSNLISWDEQLSKSNTLKRFIENEFLNETSMLYEIISAKKFRDFRTEGDAKGLGVIRRHQASWIRRYPEIYKVMKYMQAWLRKKSGQMDVAIPRGVIVRRVLTLKIWCDLFLEGKAEGTIG